MIRRQHDIQKGFVGLVRLGELNDLRRFHVEIIVLASVVSDSLLLMDELTDVNASCTSIFLNKIGQLLQVFVKIH